jgi:hypothetical protein
MNQVSIDLSESFEKVLATALSLPRTNGAWPSDAAIKQAMRYLYEVANGRIVETHIGAIPIAPPVEPWLKARPLRLKSAADLLTMVKDNLGASDSLNYARSKPQKRRQSKIGSALFEFMAGRLGAPECWPDQRNDAACTNGAARAVSRAISRWENEGGKTLSARHQPFTANNTAIIQIK